MIQRRICKSNRIHLSYTSPIGTPKSGNNKAQCVRVRIGPTIADVAVQSIFIKQSSLIFIYAYLNSAIRLMKIDCTATSAIVGPILTLTHWALLLPDFGVPIGEV